MTTTRDAQTITKSRTPRGEIRDGCDDDDGRRPNPCAPDRPDHDCDCGSRPGGTSRPKEPRKPKKRRDDCCEQIYELLKNAKGIELGAVRKPKAKPTVKAQSLCKHFGVADAILPALDLLWRRYRNGEEPRNAFEKTMEDVFRRYDQRQRDAMDAAFAGYEKLRKGGRAECLFNDCLAKAGREGPIEGGWMAAELIREGLGVAGQTFMDGSAGVMGPGQVRLWDKAVNHGPNGSGATIYVGPWPWLTAVATDVTGYQEFGNTKSFRPVPGGQHIWQPYQYATDCTYSVAQNGTVSQQCDRVHPVVPSGGIGGWCEGGPDYTKGADCVRIPAQRAGAALKLRGFNFITNTVTVRFQHATDASIVIDQECLVWGDLETPAKDGTDHSIVDERVRDWVVFDIPKGHPTIPGAALPAGLYLVTVIVDNVTGVVWDSHVPPTLQTNSLTVRIEPDANVIYRIWSDGGRCIDETGGLGSDEIWWDAFVGHMVPSEIPVDPSTPSPPAATTTTRVSFPHGPWDDMDSGESAGAFSIDLFKDAFKLGGVVVIGLIGFEVDSESAAQDQIDSFGEAYWEALKAVATVASGAEGMASAIADIAAIGLTATLIIVAVIAAVVLISLCFWAAWAPADLIALDIFAFDALKGWDLTDPKKPLPPREDLKIGDASEDSEVEVTHRPLRKVGAPDDAAATYVAEHQYDTPSGEDASYVLQFKLARGG
ncbi:MAG: hypothetical protein ABW275_10830 [Hansschlegelia sp.]